MSEEFKFHGQTTFINKPRDTVVQDFQNTYVSGDGSDRDKANKEIAKLIDLVLQSRNLPDEDKEDTTQALHSVADQVKEDKVNKLTVKGTLEAVKEIVSKGADITVPAYGLINTVLRLLGLS